MSRSIWPALPLSFLVSLLSVLPPRTARSCKPCWDPTLAALLAKADVVAVAQVVKVEVTQRTPTPQSEEPIRDVRWHVKVARPLKGSPPPQLTVKHADSPPCITARVPQPGRYVMLLYFREGQYAPLSYCDQPLFPIDAKDRVTLTPAMAKELDAASEVVPLQRVVEWVQRQAAPLPQPRR
jgi:hypothetical protein